MERVPYWLKTSLIFGIIVLIIELIVFRLEQIESMDIFLIFYIVYFILALPVVLPEWFGMFGRFNIYEGSPEGSFIPLGTKAAIIIFLFWIITGVMLGFLYGKIKNRSKILESSETLRQVSRK